MNHPETLRRDQPAIVLVQVQGRIGDRWAGWFNGLALRVDEPGDGPEVTTLTGRVADQTALLGLLSKLVNLGFPLMRVELVQGCQGPEGG